MSREKKRKIGLNLLGLIILGLGGYLVVTQIVYAYTWTHRSAMSTGSQDGWQTIAFDSTGKPAVANHRDDTGSLEYAKWNGSTWDIETVDTTGSQTGKWASLAFNASDQAIIGYVQENSGTTDRYLAFAKRVGSGGTGCNVSTWTCEIVDNPATDIKYSSLKLVNGVEAIAYHTSADDLKYAIKDNGNSGCTGGSGNWTCESVDTTGNVGRGAKLAVTSGNIPAIAYLDVTNSTMKYAIRNAGAGCASGSWTCETVVSVTVGPDENCSTDCYLYGFAFDSNNQAAFTYIVSNQLKLASRTSGAGCTSASWTCEMVAYRGGSGYSALIYNSTTPYIAYGDNSAVRLTVKVSGQWRDELINGCSLCNKSTTLGKNVDIAKTGNTLGIAYLDSTNLDTLYAETDISTLPSVQSFTLSTIATTGTVGKQNDIAFDSAGLPGVVYTDDTDKAVKYAKYDGASWTIETVKTMSTFCCSNAGAFPAITFDSSNVPHIAFNYNVSNASQFIMYAKKVAGSGCTSASWTCEQVTNYQPSGTGIKMVGSNPAIVSRPSGGWNIKYAIRDGGNTGCSSPDTTNWTCEDISGTSPSGSTFQVNGSTPAVVYSQSSILYYATRVGGGAGSGCPAGASNNWNCEVIHTSVYSTVKNGFAYNSSGTPGVIFSTSSSGGTSYYATRTGGGSGNCTGGVQWNCTPVKKQWTSTDGVDYNNLTYDTTTPRFIYTDPADNDLLYATTNGSGWYSDFIEGCQTGCPVNKNIAFSSAIFGNGKLSGTMYDSTNTDLYYFTSSFNTAPNSPTSPRLESGETPVTTDNTNPTFSWTFSDPDAGNTQSAYQILIASSTANLDANTGDVCDSGKKISASVSVSATTACGGAISTGTRYWKVRTYDNSDVVGAYTATQTITITTTPTAPTSCTTSSITATGTTIGWTDNSSSETGFQVERIPAAEAYLTITAANAVSYATTILSPNTQYAFRVAGVSGGGLSSYVNCTAIYTLANVPSAPTVTAVSSSSINTVINENSNPAATEFSIAIGSNYVQANGTLNTTQVWQTKAVWGGSSGVNITGLSANTAYSVTVIARNTSGTATSASSTTIRYTNVNTPTHTVSAVTSTQLAITIGENSNPAGTVYALQIGSNYVQAGGTVSVSAVYQTAAVWGTKTATGLTPSTTYVVQVIARNGDNSTTNGTSTSSNAYTLVDTPTQTLSNIGTTSMSVSIGTATNSSAAQYSVKFNTLYVQANGILGASQIWQTNATWTSLFSVTGLTPSTSYTVQIIARNENSDSTNGTSTGTTNSTLVDSGITQTLSTITSTGMGVTIGTGSNPGTTEYSIQFNGSNYVQANGTLSASQIWQTTAVWGSPVSVTGLTPSTSYTVMIIGRNGEGASSTSSATTAATLVATPTQTLSNITSTGIGVTIGTATNPSTTQYAIQFGSSYVQANGTLAGGQIWQTAAIWGSPVSITGLTPSTSYTIQIIGKNPDGSTSNGTSTSSTDYTLANVPNAPTVTAVSSSSINTVINENSNPAATEFSIAIGSNYVQANGTLNTTQVWQTKAVWGGSSGVNITGLSANTAYSVTVIARNINPTPSITTASSATVRYTHANAPTITASAVITTGATLTIGENSNPSETTYAIAFTVNTVTRDAGDNPVITTPSPLTYLQTDKTIGATAAYQTAAVWANPALTNLIPVTSYTIQALAKNGDNDATNGTGTSVQFETLANPPANQLTASNSQSSIVITWESNGNTSNARYSVSRSGGQTSGWIGGNTWTETGMLSTQTYTYTIKAKNMSGTETTPVTINGTTLSGGGGAITLFQQPQQTRQTTRNETGGRETGTETKTSCQENPPKIKTIYEYGENFPLNGSEILTFDLRKANNITHYWTGCGEAQKYELHYSGNNFRSYVKVWEGQHDNVGIAGIALGKQLERMIKSSEGKIAIRIRTITVKEETIDGIPLELQAEIVGGKTEKKLVDGIIKIDTEKETPRKTNTGRTEKVENDKNKKIGDGKTENIENPDTRTEEKPEKDEEKIDAETPKITDQKTPDPDKTDTEKTDDAKIPDAEILPEPEIKIITLQIGKTISLKKEKEDGTSGDPEDSGRNKDGTRITDRVTRGEFLAAVVENLELKVLHKNVLSTTSLRKAAKKFNDIKPDSINYQNIIVATNIGLTDGVNQNRNTKSSKGRSTQMVNNLEPQNYITKAEAVRVMLIALEEIKPQTCTDIISEVGSIKKLLNSQTPFADIDPGKIDKCWYPKVINRACEIGIIDCKRDKVHGEKNFEPKSLLTKPEFRDLLDLSKDYAEKIGLKDKFTRDTDDDRIIDIFEKEIYKTDPSKKDTDSDLLNDGEEINQYGTNPLKEDTDTDGLIDGEEVLNHRTNPLKKDTDGDGFNDKQEINGKTDPLNPENVLPDDDGNKVDDKWEKKHRVKVKNGQQDSDKDGISDTLEYQIGTNPNDPDTDKDNLTDTQEFLDFNTDPLIFTLPEEIKVQILLPTADQIVTSPNPLFKGTAKAGSKVEIALRNEFGIDTIIAETHTTENEVFIVQAPLLQNDRYIFVAREINEQTGEMRISEPAHVRIDTTFNVKTPEADSLGNAILKNRPAIEEIDILVNSTVPALRGQVEFGNQVVTIWKSAVQSASLIADSESGNFEIRPPERLAPGPHEVIIYSIKKENNAVSEILKIKFKVIDGAIEDSRLISYQDKKGGKTSFVLNKTSKPLFFNIFAILIGSSIIGFLISQYRKRKEEDDNQ